MDRSNFESDHSPIPGTRNCTLTVIRDPNQRNLLGRLYRPTGTGDDLTARRVSATIWGEPGRKQVKFGLVTIETRIADQLYLVTDTKQPVQDHFAGAELSAAVQLLFESNPELARRVAGI